MWSWTHSLEWLENLDSVSWLSTNSVNGYTAAPLQRKQNCAFRTYSETLLNAITVHSSLITVRPDISRYIDQAFLQFLNVLVVSLKAIRASLFSLTCVGFAAWLSLHR